MRKKPLHSRTAAQTGPLDWEALRTVLAVARGGSLSQAARELNVEHSTVYRRIANIEGRLSVRLFDRTRRGYLVNVHGEAIAEAARSMEQAALAAERRVFGADTSLKGSIRVATSEPLATHLMPALAAGFLAAHPEIRLEISVANRPVNLTRREADLALRGCEAPPEHLIGQQVATVRYAVYVGGALAARSNKLAQLDWLGFDDELAQIAPARWLRRAFPDVTPRLLFNSLTAMQSAVANGLGAAVLPQFTASSCPGLVQISEPLPDLRAGIWLLRHPDVRGNTRVQAFAHEVARRLPSFVDTLVGKGARRRKLFACPKTRPGKQWDAQVMQRMPEI